MKVFVLVLLAASSLSIDPIGKINSLKSEAKEAYLNGDYQQAISKYKILMDSLNVKEEALQLNLANAYFAAGDSINAANYYRSLTRSSNLKTKSLANQQLGVVSNRAGQFEEALHHFKEALKANPANEDARYNYEMVKKKLEEQKKQDQQQKDQNKDDKENQDKQDQKDQQNKDKKDQDQQNKDQKDQQQQDQKDKQEEQKDKKQQEQDKEQKSEEQKDEKEIPPSVKEKLKEMQMSEEKAKMILEAMKNQEIQYLQQNKRKATKPKDKAKPDW